MKVNLPRFKISLKPSRIKYIFIYPRLLTVQTKCAPESNFTPAVTGGSSAHLTISGCHVLAWSYDAVSPPAPLPGHSSIPRAFSAPATVKGPEIGTKSSGNDGESRTGPSCPENPTDPSFRPPATFPRQRSGAHSSRPTLEAGGEQLRAEGRITAEPEQLGPGPQGLAFQSRARHWSRHWIFTGTGPARSWAAFILPPQSCLDTRTGDISRKLKTGSL